MHKYRLNILSNCGQLVIFCNVFNKQLILVFKKGIKSNGHSDRSIITPVSNIPCTPHAGHAKQLRPTAHHLRTGRPTGGIGHIGHHQHRLQAQQFGPIVPDYQVLPVIDWHRLVNHQFLNRVRISMTLGDCVDGVHRRRFSWSIKLEFSCCHTGRQPNRVVVPA